MRKKITDIDRVQKKVIFRNYQLYILFVLVIVSLSLTYGCKKLTNMQNGTLFGIVRLVNDTGDATMDSVDNSGVLVSLYNSTVLDTAIGTVNVEHPQIGVIGTPEFLFDHRDYPSLCTTVSVEDGSFRFVSIPPGKYCLVIRKLGWGLRYLHNVEIFEGQETSIGVDSKKKLGGRLKSNFLEGLVLYPAVKLDSAIQNNIELMTNHTYIVETDTAVLGSAHIQAGARILIAPGSRLDFYHSVSTDQSGTPWIITSSYGIYEDNVVIDNSSKRFSRISHTGDGLLSMTNGRITHIQDGLQINSSNASINSVYFENGGVSLISNGPYLSIDRCVVRNFNDRAVVIYNTSIVKNCIFHNNHENMTLTGANVEVRNNYFAMNWLAIRPIYGSINIHHNDFINNRWSISTVASDPLIQYNNFFGSIRYCIQTQANYVQNSFDYSNPTINNNNFFKKTGVAISIKPDAHPGYFNSSDVGVVSDIDAKRNYWGVADPETAIIDVMDDPTHLFKIVHIPKLTNRVSSAGM